MASRKKKTQAAPEPPLTRVPIGEKVLEPLSPSSRAGLILVGLSTLFTAWILRGEVTISAPQLNDMVLHQTLIRNPIAAWQAGGSFLDPWVPGIALGYPVWHAYQPLPHVATALVALFTGGDAALVASWVLLLLLTAFPAAIYFLSRSFGLSPVAAGSASAVAALIDSGARYGLELRSYTWSGSGLFTQAWAQLALAIALALTWRALRKGRGHCAAGAAVAATFLCHSVYGLVAVIASVVMVIASQRKEQTRAAAGGALVLLVSAAGVAFFVLPLLLDHDGVNRSRWELQWKWDSFGASEVLRLFATGALFDGGGLPLVTLAVLAGLVLVFWKHQGGARYAGIMLVLSTALFFGRATWGVLYKLVPMSNDLPQHRLIGAVQMFAIVVAGCALGAAAEAVARRRNDRTLLLGVSLIILFLSPAAVRQVRVMQQDRAWKLESLRAYQTDRADIERLTDTIRQEDRGRVFAGLAATWGRDVRVGAVPLYGILAERGFATNSFLYHAMSLPSDLVVLFDENDRDHYRIFNVGWYVTEATRDVPRFLQPAGRFGRFALYRAPGGNAVALATASAPAPVHPREHFTASEAWLKSSFARREALPLWSADGSYPSTGDRVAVSKSSWHPRIRATVDGKPAAVFMVAPAFSAVVFPPGSRTVTFRYESQWWRSPLAAGGWLAIIIAAILERRRDLLGAVLGALERKETRLPRFSRAS